MSRFDEMRRLPFLALMALLLASPRLLPAQAPAEAQTPAALVPSQTSAQPPVQSPAGGATTAGQAPISPVTDPNPEDLGDSLEARQRYQAAIAAYSKIAEPSAAVWNKMGIAYQMMFNPKDAIRCYNASLKLDSRNSSVLNNLGTVYDSLKQYATAERYYRRANKSDPHSALILRNLGSNQLSQHRYKKGWEAYQSALAIDPQIFQSRNNASIANPATTQERGAMHYYMAKGCTSAGNSECAINNLRLALNEGYTNPKKIAADSSFASLREVPAFQQLIAAQSAP